MSKNKLFLVSSNYPYYQGEVFLDKEVKEFAAHFDILILPQEKRNDTVRPSDLDFELNDGLLYSEKDETRSILFKNLKLVLWILGTELFYSKRRFYILKRLKWVLSIIKNALNRAKKLELILEKQGYQKGKDVLYSVWLDEGALTLAILKKRKVISGFSFRLHGFDLFDERREGNYVTFRDVCFRSVNHVLTLSQAGTDYLREKYPEKSIITCYSGLYDFGMGPEDKLNADSLTIVSCSNLVPIKRAERIVEALRLTTRKINWLHFGDGELTDELKESAKTLPANVNHKFKGRVSNDEIIDFYLNNYVDLFIHLSETEGLGMALVEAQSFGIPCLACNVGGVGEVVNSETGVLLDVNFASKEVSELLEDWESVLVKNQLKRENCRNHFLSNFNASKNYIYFKNLLLENN